MSIGVIRLKSENDLFSYDAQEIKSGEYVRTDYGIAKLITMFRDREGVVAYKLDRFFITHRGDFENLVYSEEISEHSFNIIDLIQVGDYVNGELIDTIKEPAPCNNNTRTIYGGECEGLWKLIISTCGQKEIENILTKEQFNNYKYEVK